MANLHGELGSLTVGGAHAFGMIYGEGHGLFLVDVLAGFNGVDEVLAMQMLGSGDDDGVDGFVIQKAAMVEICCGAWYQRFGVFQAFGVDIGEGDEIEIGAGQGPMDQLSAAGADAMMPIRI